MHPTGLVDTLAVLMLATSTYCVVRLVAARAWKRHLNRDTNIAHTADGVAMAGMLVGSLRTLPVGAWEVVFAVLTLWFAGRAAHFLLRFGIGAAVGDGLHHMSHYTSHLVMSGAMFYMFIEASPSRPGVVAGSMSAMGGAGATSNLTEFTLLLVLALFASAVWHADGLTRYTTTAPALVAAGVTASSGSAHMSQTAPATPTPTQMTQTTHTAPTSVAPGGPNDGVAVSDPDADQARWLAPRLEIACHIALCITMGYMLILML